MKMERRAWIKGVPARFHPPQGAPQRRLAGRAALGLPIDE
jgi:hypothetical protein